MKVTLLSLMILLFAFAGKAQKIETTTNEATEGFSAEC